MPKLKRKSKEMRSKESRSRMQISREDVVRRSSEKERDLAARHQARQNKEKRRAEQSIDTQAHRKAREDEEKRKAEQAVNSQARRKAREDEEKRKAEQAVNSQARRKARENEEKRRAEQTVDTRAHRKAREDEEKRKAEQVVNSQSRRLARKDEEKRKAEQAVNSQARRKTREDEEKRKADQAVNSQAHRKAREDEEKRKSEQSKNTASHRTARLSLNFKASEQKRNSASKRNRRQDESFRTPEMASDSSRKRKRRENSDFKQSEYTAKRLCRRLFQQDFDKLLKDFNTKIRLSPTTACSCCGCLWYETSTTKITMESMRIQHVPEEIIDKVFSINLEDPHFCSACKRHILNSNKDRRKVPRLALSNGFDFVEIPEELKNLSPLEERLVALRIPFMQIRLRGAEGQAAIRGNVVNVENDIPLCTEVIPRPFNKTGTVHIKLMRKMSFARPYLEERISPYKVFRAAKYLVGTELYRQEDVRLCDEWQDHDIADSIDFICNDEEDTNENLQNRSNECYCSGECQCGEKPSISRETEDESANAETDCIHEAGCDESLLYLDKELEYQGLKLAPGEGKLPIPFFRDPHAEEMSFPSIYCGIKRQFKVKATYTDIAKSEIRRYDRRACSASHLLYCFKKSLNEKVYNELQICLRQRSGSSNITAKMTKTPGYLQQLIEKDDGYAVFKNIRSSPCYWKKQQKKVNSMIRQVGKPHLFITLSAAETRWNELLTTLSKTVYNKIITENEASQLSFLEKADLIRKDPVTCMLNYDHRFRQLLNGLLKKDGGIFSPFKLIDFFTRIEFQMRGSPHTHGVYWLADAPTYKAGCPRSEKEVLEFVDKFITCKRDEEGEMEELLGYQLHKHSHTCYKKNRKKVCRFGFPKPPLPDSLILHPFEKTADQKLVAGYRKTYGVIQEKLTEMGRSYKDNVDFSSFLQSLELSKNDYILAVRSSIKRSTVFLKRSTSEAFINNYNKKLLLAWRANIDIQYILDTYACAKYCVGYIMKSDGGVSKLLRAAESEAKAGNVTVLEKLKKFAKVICQGCEVSTQEAAAFLLGLPNTTCSRQDVFVNTNSPQQRIGILRPQDELNELEDDSEDIYVKGIYDHYTHRPEEMESVCLADFATLYDKVGKSLNASNSNKLPDEDNEEDDNDYTTNDPDNEAPSMQLLDGSGYMKKRRTRKILRFRSFNKETEFTNYCRERLTLFRPFRNEQEEILDVNSVIDFEKFKDTISENSQPYFALTENEEMLINKLIGESDEEQLEDEADINSLQNKEKITEDEEAMFRGIGQQGRPRAPVEQFRPPKMVSEDDYLKMMRSLNDRQRRFVLNVLHQYKTSAKPFYYFLSGGAGVGKSHVIHAIVQSVLRHEFRTPSENPEQPPVAVCAPTGKAAFNVFGMTMHTTFRLPANQDMDWSDLTDSKANTYRSLLRNIKLIIIDEISMVNANQLHQLNKRLQQLFCNYEDFGGISVIVVGHLRQLSPIMAKHVFMPSTQFPNIMNENLLWQKFEFFELEEIMRQRGQHDFCHALNNMAEGTMSDDEEALIKSREITLTNHPPPNAIWLFYSNRECEEYNEKFHRTMDSEGAWAIAHDMVKGEANSAKMEYLLKKAELFQASDAEGLPYKTHLQIGAEYFVSTNIDVSDGLFNGSTGTLRQIEYGTNAAGESVPNQVWMDFHNIMVGSTQRAKTKNYQLSKNINTNWTLIKRYERSMNLGREYRGIELIRKQIPLVAANAMTIAKSQGSSIPCVVVTPNSTRKNDRSYPIKREELYVACSRATSLEGLYINGNFRKPAPPEKDDDVTKELENLKRRQLRFNLNFLQDVSETHTTLYFMNVQSVIKHYEDIKSDICPMSSNFLAFVEPHILEADNVTFDGYRYAHRRNSRSHHSSDGSLLLVNEAVNYPAVYDEVASDTSGHCLCTFWKYNNVKFVMSYRSPKCSMATYKKLLENVLQSTEGFVVFFGDVNIDLSKQSGESFLNYMSTYNLKSVLDTNCATTNDATHIDCLFSNMPNLQGSLYETYYSHHKAICIVLP